ncbi:tRNA (adenosine(37)-N6)-dimethylallyltransferase MiaA [Desertivirga arenae]|uniref:tRNA (adenosine(37)-N6)-dimethylallyltransferase MiaA n=1 Tax=Desertivirga arenae TaxID=2810309 RepID=UPI001A9690D0|nr:tRNA (adenosine(37)-N6)-dimethylallyltransferase MiaA [Pedobacter sp. SYSU D00823]
MSLKKTLIVIAGPTAIGKTELAIKIAQHFSTEIISADSRQFYKEMSIGTAKPSFEELRAAPHHFINSHHITDNFTVGDFEKQGLELIKTLFEKHNLLILAGGSGLFVKAITDGFDQVPKATLSIREDLNRIFAEHGIEVIQKKLQQLDPLYYSEVDLSNPQRIIRGLEVCLSTGLPFSSFRTGTRRNRDFNIIKIGLNMDRDKLYNRINHRVEMMFTAGLVEEVKQLNSYRNLNALNTVGYSEVFDYLDGKITQMEAVEQIKQNTRRFAKRQLTWFKKDKGFNWFEPSELDLIINHITEKAEDL